MESTLKYTAASCLLLLLLVATSATGRQQQQVPLSLNKQETTCHVDKEINATTTLVAAATSGGHDEKRKSSLEVLVNVFTQKQLELVSTYLYSFDQLRAERSRTIAEYRNLALMARAHIDFNNLLMHRYDSPAELSQSGGPQADQELCLRQLRRLNRRAERQKALAYRGRDFNLHQLLDTYGRLPAGLLQLKTRWEGMHVECERLRIQWSGASDDATQQQVEDSSETRYCFAHFNYRGTQNTTLSSLFTMKMAVCLPAACDSLDYEDKFRLVGQLADFNAPSHERGQMDISQLYCLPDQRSPTRSWWLSKPALLFLLATSAWLALIAHSSLTSTPNRLQRLISVQSSLQSLFAPSKQPVSLQDLQEHASDITSDETLVDLRPLDGIKVLCMWYVIVGHVQTAMSQIVDNLGDMMTINSSSYLYVALNLMPSHAINAFFAITGLLTSYLMFKRHQAHQLVRRPQRWILFALQRYMRLMPVYVLVVAYAKYLARFMGHGPMWDYGTSHLGARHRCQQESWLSVLLFGANLKPVADNCIPSAWYYANDFQFYSLAAPLFLAALHYSPALGRNLLKMCAAAGSFAAILHILRTSGPDLRPVFSFMPHGYFMRYVFLSTTYTWPQFRIPAYLCGLLIGYELYKFELHKLKFLKQSSDGDAGLKEPTWSRGFQRHGPRLILALLVICILAPIFLPRPLLDQLPSELLVILSWPSHHLIFSLALGLYILLASTGHGNQTVNRFLAAPIWKPLARLHHCVFLTHWELIIYTIQIRSHAWNADDYIHVMLNPIIIVQSYAVAMCVYVLFEAPLKALMDHLVTPCADSLKVGVNSDEATQQTQKKSLLKIDESSSECFTTRL